MAGPMVEIKVSEAKNLPAADLNGLSDPFCQIFVNNKKVFTTTTKKKTLNPVWNEKFGLQLPNAGDKVELKFYDKDKFSANDLLGTVTLTKDEIQKLSDDKEFNGWFNLNPPNSGSVKLFFTINGMVFPAENTQTDIAEFPDNWTCYDIVTRTSGAQMLSGVLWEKSNQNVVALREQILECPDDVKFLSPVLAYDDKMEYFSSKSQCETFIENVDSIGYQAAVNVNAGIKLFSADASGSGSYNKYSGSSATHEKSANYMSHVVSSIVPLAAIKLDLPSLKLTKGVLKKLDDLQASAKNCPKLSALFNQIKEFFSRFGSHISTGLVHFGGIFLTTATLEGQCSRNSSEIKGMLAQKAQASISMKIGIPFMSTSASGSGSYERSSSSTNKSFDQKEMDKINVNTKRIGGLPIAPNLNEWKETLAQEENKSSWRVIDRGSLDTDFKGIWEVIDNHRAHFTYPDAIALLLNYHWHKLNQLEFKVGNQLAANELVRLLTKEIVGKLSSSGDDTKREVYRTQLVEYLDFFKSFERGAAVKESLFELRDKLKSSANESNSGAIESVCNKLESMLKLQ